MLVINNNPRLLKVKILCNKCKQEQECVIEYNVGSQFISFIWLSMEFYMRTLQTS